MDAKDKDGNIMKKFEAGERRYIAKKNISLKEL
jgi:hypothetical protein